MEVTQPILTETLITPEKAVLLDSAVFDWTEDRKNGIITASKNKLGEYVDGLVDLDEDDKNAVKNLWMNVIACFQEGGDLTIKGKVVASFNKNTLAAHSEYHISKVLTIAMSLQEKEFPDAGLEDKLALVLGDLLHDLGSLQRKDDPHPQPLLYENHELHSIGMVDDIINALNIQGVDQERLKTKVKLMTATTLVQFDMDFAARDINNLPIIRLLRGEARDQVFPPDPNKTDGYRDKMVEVVLDMKRKLTSEQIDQLIPYLKVMGASDMGSYLLEICRIGEINNLFQETNEFFWDEEKKVFRHRALPSGIENYHQYLVSKFPDTQKAIYGDMLRELGNNPFAPSHTVDQTLGAIDEFNKLLRQPVDEDPLLRFEGYFPPKDLMILIKELGIDISGINPNDPNDINLPLYSLHAALLKFSKEFSGGFHKPGEFDALATDVLREIFRCCDTPDKRKDFFLKALKIIDDGITDEINKGGKINLHFAPFAYMGEGINLDDIINPFDKAVAELNGDEERKHNIASVTLTLREDKGDDLKALVEKAKNTSKESGIPWQISIGGIAQEAEKLEEYLNATVGVKTVVHFGLDADFKQFDQRLDVVLNRDIKGIQIHVDDHYKRFTTYSEHLDQLVKDGKISSDEQEKRLRNLTDLIKSLNPLGAVLTRGTEEYETLMEFFRKFPASRELIASHNACLYGGLGSAAQRLLAKVSEMREKKVALT